MPGMHFSWYYLLISEDEKSQNDQKWDELNSTVTSPSISWKLLPVSQFSWKCCQTTVTGGSASFQSCKKSLPAVGLPAACRNTSLGRPMRFVLLSPPNRATITICTSGGVQEQCVTLTATCSAIRISSSTCSFLVHKKPYLSHLCFRPRTNSHNFLGSNGSLAKQTAFFIEERWELIILSFTWDKRCTRICI